MKTKIKVLSAMIVAGAALGSQGAFAIDGTINFDGLVTASTCTVSSSGGSNNFTVALPTVAESALSGANSTAGRTPFAITLSGCAASSGNVHTFFESGATTGASGNLALEGAGSAQNVEIQLLNQDLSEIKAGYTDAAQNSKAVAIDASGNATLNYNAQYISTAGSAVAGEANSSVAYTIAYQ
ncbi:Major fimbrial subunit precursor [compost metagenome]